MKHLLCTVLSVLVLSQVFSQSIFKEGYIITNENDTIYGSICYNNSKKASFECLFKKNNDSSDEVTYTPDDIAAYRFLAGKYYVSMKLHPDDTSKVFLEYLIDGIVDLFFYEDKTGGHYLIQKEGAGLNELRNELKETYRNGEKYAYETKEYIGLLKINFGDSPDFIKKSENVGLYHNDLIKIAKDYHNAVCEDRECIVFAKEKSKLQYEFGLFTGITFSKISFTGNNSITKLTEGLSSGTDFNIGTFINIKDPLISEKIYLHSELLVSKNQYSVNDVNIDFISLKIPVALQYQVPERRITPVIMLGLLFNNMISLNDSGIAKEGSGIEHGRVQAGLTGGIGIESKFISNSKIFLIARGEYLFGKHYNMWRTLQSGGNKTKTNFNSISECVGIYTGIKF